MQTNKTERMKENRKKEAEGRDMKIVPGKKMLARSCSTICMMVNIDSQLGTDSDGK